MAAPLQRAESTLSTTSTRLTPPTVRLALFEPPAQITITQFYSIKGEWLAKTTKTLLSDESSAV